MKPHNIFLTTAVVIFTGVVIATLATRPPKYYKPVSPLGKLIISPFAKLVNIIDKPKETRELVDLVAIERAVEAALKEAPGTWAVSVRVPESNQKLDINHQSRFHGASLHKLPTLFAI